ncbi:hypothetical protein JCM17960_10030 [Magnetospira thiophila]
MSPLSEPITNCAGLEKHTGKLLSACVLFGLVVLGGCATTDSSSPVMARGAQSIADAIPEDKVTSEPRRLAAEGIRHLDGHDLDAALIAFNKALAADGANAMLNFFTALTYHLQALDGADGEYDLARQGYDRAIRIDPSNWVAYYFAGLLELDQRNFRAAQNRFAEALNLDASDPDLLYNMAVASYYVGDLPLAEGVLRQLRAIEPDSERVRRASAMTLAGLGDTDAAQIFADGSDGSGSADPSLGALAKRLADWNRFYARNQKQLAEIGISSEGMVRDVEPGWQDSSVETAPKPAAAPTGAVETGPLDDTEANEASPGEEKKKDADENQMVIVDVVIIRTEETATTSKGVNLLNSLTMELGSSNSNAAFQATTSSSKTVGNVTKAISSALTIPSITYSINIANAANSRTEILARPTLVAMNGEKSEFFSGVSIKASTLPSTAGGTGDSVSIEDDVGVKLGITPTLLDDGRVKIEVEAERKYLNTPNSKITGFTSTLETSRTTVGATVAMRFGNTLILSGLSEKESESTDNGVPLLRDIPIVQYLFDKKTTTDFNRSVLLLITPRLPEYVYQKGVTDAAKPGDNDALNDFRALYADWFKPYPNWASVFRHMQDNALYREFRTGDVALERWEAREDLSFRLKQAIDFLYY